MQVSDEAQKLINNLIDDAQEYGLLLELGNSSDKDEALKIMRASQIDLLKYIADLEEYKIKKMFEEDHPIPRDLDDRS